MEAQSYQTDPCALNERLAYQVLCTCLKVGVQEFCLCPGGRNTAFVDGLKDEPSVKTYFFFDERAAAFFALGRSKVTGRPTAVITTSGTAVGELLPAAMEAYYSGIPLLLVTADRPKLFRGSGAPQSAEQESIFGIYTPFARDIGEEDTFSLALWNQRAPAHLNVCLEEKYRHDFTCFPDFPLPSPRLETPPLPLPSMEPLEAFFRESLRPIALVGALLEQDREAVIQFLLKTEIPVYCEALSGIRQDPRLAPLRIMSEPNHLSALANTPIDGVLRLGTVPTTRFWRDLENLKGTIPILSVSHLPFSGLSWGGAVVHTEVGRYLRSAESLISGKCSGNPLLETGRSQHQKLMQIIAEEPRAEAAMVYQISLLIEEGDTLFLGNSQPIREWDLAASYENRVKDVYASRGLNGIDGQLSTFLGVVKEECGNWALFGDLTTLYDLAAPWILSQLPAQRIALLVINNRGGKIFSRLYQNPQIQNPHDYTFEHLAGMWRMHYEKWESVPKSWKCTRPTLIECVPDNDASDRFWSRLK